MTVAVRCGGILLLGACLMTVFLKKPGIPPGADVSRDTGTVQTRKFIPTRLETQVPDIYDVHVSNMNADFSGEPFLRPGDLAVTWKSGIFGSKSTVVIASDPGMTDTVATVHADAGDAVIIPEAVLNRSGVYYYRVFLEKSGEEHSVLSDINWFAVDPRFTGNRIVMRGFHPLGKSECPVTARDYRGVIHLTMDHWQDDSGRREVLWFSSDDEGMTWENHGPVSSPDHIFSGLSSIAAGNDGRMLYIGYLAGNDPVRMPRTVAVTRCDLTAPEPRFEKPHVFFGRSGLAWRRPYIAVDDNQVAHIAWDSPDTSEGIGIYIGGIQIRYSNNVTGNWKKPCSVSPLMSDNPAGGTHMACVGNTVHVFWESGMWRYSQDYGESWIPPLNEPAACFMPEPAENERARWRLGASVRIPGTGRLAAAMVREPLREDGINWTYLYNMNEIWLIRYHCDTGWETPFKVYSVEQQDLVPLNLDPDQPVQFIERPSLSADGTGTLYLSWDETHGAGGEWSEWHRKAYMLSIAPDNRFGAPVPLPETGHLSNMKPLLGAPRDLPGCDITWTVGTIPSRAIRPIRPDGPMEVQGIMFATHRNLQQQDYRPTVFKGAFQSVYPGDISGPVEPFPAVIPKGW